MRGRISGGPSNYETAAVQKTITAGWSAVKRFYLAAVRSIVIER
jgi:hypothetical protein